MQDIKSICTKFDSKPVKRLLKLTALALSPEHLKFEKDPELHKECIELFLQAWNGLTSLKLLDLYPSKEENPCIAALH